MKAVEKHAVKMFVSVLFCLLSASCTVIETNQYCKIKIENLTGSDISDVQLVSKIDDGRTGLTSFGFLATGTASGLKKVLCSIYLHDSLGSGTLVTYQVQVQYNDASSVPVTVTVPLGELKGKDPDLDPDTLVSDRKYLIVLNSGSSHISEL